MPALALTPGTGKELEGRYAEGWPHLEKARRLRPDFWGTLYYLGRARLQTNRAEEALPLLEEASRLNPGEAAIFYQLGRALKACGREDDARRAMDRVRELRAGKLRTEVELLTGK